MAITFWNIHAARFTSLYVTCIPGRNFIVTVADHIMGVSGYAVLLCPGSRRLGPELLYVLWGMLHLALVLGSAWIFFRRRDRAGG